MTESKNLKLQDSEKFLQDIFLFYEFGTIHFRPKQHFTPLVKSTEHFRYYGIYKYLRLHFGLSFEKLKKYLK